MTSPSSSGFIFGFVSSVALATAGIITVQAAGVSDPVRLTASTNVALREAPDAGSAAIAHLQLGTEVTEAGPLGMDKTWVRVKLADGREGWLNTSLTRVVDPGRRWLTIDRIIHDRLGRHGDSFAATVELTDFMERVSTEVKDAEVLARLHLDWLTTVGSAAAAIPWGQGGREPYVSWINRHKTLVVYDEPGARWILDNKAIAEYHARFSTTRSADEIAWLAVTNGLAGECEGRVTCYLDWRNRLEGEYLRAHPLGRHAAEAVTAIKDTADRLSGPSASRELRRFDRTRDCGGLTTTLEALRLTLASTGVAEKDAAAQSLAGLRAWCK